MAKKMKAKPGVDQKKVKPSTGVQESGHKKKRKVTATVKAANK
jgi:hypothetical protein